MCCKDRISLYVRGNPVHPMSTLSTSCGQCRYGVYLKMCQALGAFYFQILLRKRPRIDSVSEKIHLEGTKIVQHVMYRDEQICIRSKMEKTD